MNRSRLIWFAAGAATSVIASLAAMMLSPKPASLTPFLILDEPAASPALKGNGLRTSTEALETSFIANKAGELLHGCGAKSFKVTVPENGRPTADFPLNEENARAVECALTEAAGQKYRIGFELRPD